MGGKKKHAGGGFAGIPRCVMEHKAYRSLPANAVKLLNALAYQYRGANNGNLTASFATMRGWGFKAKDTLTKATRALLEAELIVQTRAGVFQSPGGRCALYALTWHPIDECPGKHLDMRPTRNPPRNWAQ